MHMLPEGALSIRSSERGTVLRRLRAEQLIDTRFTVLERDGFAIIPLRSRYSQSAAGDLGSEADTALFEGRWSGPPFELARQNAAIEEWKRRMLPQKWEMIGRSLLLKLRPELRSDAAEIGRAYAMAAGAESVYSVEGKMRGVSRKPSVRLVYGKGGETVHHENGVNYVLDAGKVMFSSANHDERMRMSTIDCGGETVVDMFAGIGHLSMPLAVHSDPARIIAAELDETTFRYLMKTVEANEVLPTYSACNIENSALEVEACDRILMGYLHETRRWLPKALSMGKAGTIIHFHEEVRKGMVEEWKRLITSKYCGGRVNVLSTRRVKGYSALSDHMAMDLQITG